MCGLDLGSCPSEETRRTEAYWTRVQSAHANFLRPVPFHVNNGDETRYASTRIASYSKGLPHDELGHVLPSAYDAYLKALATGSQADFEAIPIAGARKLVNPARLIWKDLTPMHFRCHLPQRLQVLNKLVKSWRITGWRCYETCPLPDMEPMRWQQRQQRTCRGCRIIAAQPQPLHCFEDLLLAVRLAPTSRSFSTYRAHLEQTLWTKR